MSEVRDALIVAGGRGTRLQPLTHDVPKPLLPLCGTPFLAGVIRRLARAGVTRVHLVVGAETSPFERLRPYAEHAGVELATVPEPEPLDTAGGVRAVAGTFDGPVLVLNGDILTDVDYAAVASQHVASGADATIVLVRVDDTSSFGVAVRDGDQVTRFVEKPAPGTLPGQDAINAGTYVLEPSVLLAHDEGPLSFERDVFPGLLDRGGHLEGMVWEGVWADLGTPERYLEGHRLALDGALDWPPLDDIAESGAGLRVAADAEVHADAALVAPVLVLPGAVIGPGATVGPHSVVGRNSQVGAGAIVEGSVLFDRVQLATDVVARGLLAGDDVVVERGVALGRAVVLGAGEVVPEGSSLADEERRPAPEG